MPRLGVVGSAWATTLCRWVMVLLVAVLGAPGWWPWWRRSSPGVWSLRSILRMLAIGVPIGVQMGFEMGVFTAAALLIGTMLSFMVPLGIGAAAATRVGNAIGRGDPFGARRGAAVALGMGASVMVISATVFALLPRQLAHLYSPDPQVIGAAAQLIPIAAIFQIFDGTQAVGCGVLRGAGDTRVAAAINLFGYWALGLPLGVLLAYRGGLGPRGLWWGLTAGLAVVATLLVWRIVVRFRRPIARV
jgi:MATE family multidrug resistance protein